jgi:hypothetical protein
VERALQLARTHDPRRAIPGVVRTLRLTQHEAELLLNHAAARLRPSRWKLTVGADRLQLQASLRLPDNPFGAWLNVELHARQTRGLPQLETVTLGRLPLPVPLVEWALDAAAARYGLGAYRTLAAVAVQQVRLGPQRIEVVYAWGPDAPTRVLAALLPERRTRAAAGLRHELAQLAAATPTARAAVAVAAAAADVRAGPPAQRRGQDPALENRAALMVLGMVANGIGLGVLLPERAAELAAPTRSA